MKKVTPERDRELTQVIIHEFHLSEMALNHFLRVVEAIKVHGETYQLQLEAYKFYSDFVCHLYEHFMAAFEREVGLHDLHWTRTDKMLEMYAQQHFTNTADMIEAGIGPEWANDLGYYQVEIPEGFGKKMRDIRNNHNHGSYRRGGDRGRISLNEFREGYHKYVFGLFQLASWWSTQRLSDYRIPYVERFKV